MNLHHLLLQLFQFFHKSPNKIKMAPHSSISPLPFLEICDVSPPGNMSGRHHKNTQWKQVTVKSLGVTFFKEFPWGRVKTIAPDISTWGEQNCINKKQLQPVTWFCLLFPIYIN